MAIPLSAWVSSPPHDNRRSVDLVRVATAVVILIHPLHALLHREDVHALASELSARGIGSGDGLAWGATVAALVSSMALLVPRLVLPGTLGALVLVVGGALLLYAPRYYVVGGDEDGNPGVELNLLLALCLAGVLLTYWPGREGEKERRARWGFDIIRVASALALLAHGAPAFVTMDFEGMRGWGESMTAHGWPFGLALVWSIKSTELVGSLLRLSRRFVVPACLGHLSYLVPALWIYHKMRWFDIGPGVNGIEFPVMLIVCSVACILAYWPRRESVLATAYEVAPREVSHGGDRQASLAR